MMQRYDMSIDNVVDNVYGPANPEPHGPKNLAGAFAGTSPAQRRAITQGETKAKNAKRIAELLAEVESLRKEGGCEHCTGLPHGAQHLKFGAHQTYGLDYDNADRGSLWCPMCKTCLAAWE